MRRGRAYLHDHCDLENVRGLFDEVDADGDEHVTLAEFSAFFENVAARAGVPPLEWADVEATFAFCDTAANGTVEREEFERFLEIFHNGGDVNWLDV